MGKGWERLCEMDIRPGNKATYVQIFGLGVALTGHLSFMYICEGKAEQQKMGETSE